MKHTLLIVEDDLDTSEMLRVYFEAQGYHVITAGGGQEALEKCRTEPPDLILLDVRLPDIDGFEVGQSLQNDVRTSRHHLRTIRSIDVSLFSKFEPSIVNQKRGLQRMPRLFFC